MGFGLAVIASGAAWAAPGESLPPSPFEILRGRALETPYLDAVAYCRPVGLDDRSLDPALDLAASGQWSDAARALAERPEQRRRDPAGEALLAEIFAARRATTRSAWRDAEARFAERLLDAPPPALAFCARLERARLLALLSREAEASAQVVLAKRLLDADDFDAPPRHRDEVAFVEAELLYRTGRAFESHLAFRRLADSVVARLALAARLRLTDLSFEAGKTEQVGHEYEALLPRASAFGASTTAWALRAAETAIEGGLYERAQHWMELFARSGPARDVRDTAEIRFADLDVALDDPMAARQRLAGVTGRRSRDQLGALASVRAIDLGVAAGDPDQHLERLLEVVRGQREGVRRYALGVLMRELARRDAVGGALAVATRLAYDGADPVVNPDFPELLDELLALAAAPTSDEIDCRRLVRRLGGRYGILIERASSPDPFTQVGLCFERLEMPGLAEAVYRTVARRFGRAGAEAVDLPLARASLAIGELALADRMAAAALGQGDPREAAWRAVRGEVAFAEGRTREAAVWLRPILDEASLAAGRARLVGRFSETYAGRDALADARHVADRMPDWLAADAASSRARTELAGAAIRTAHRLRERGDRDRANRLYRLVAEAGRGDALESAARFWLERLGPAGDDAARPGGEAHAALGAPWERMARFEQAYQPLRAAYVDVATGDAATRR